MAMDPEIAAFVAGMPTPPSYETVDIDVMREGVNQAMAYMPKLDVPLASIEDRTIQGPASILPIRIYTPQGQKPAPILVFCHGGGWMIGDLNMSDSLCRALCFRAGVIVLSVDYRLAPQHPFPAPADDAYAALVWAATHAAEIGGDPNRIAVGGDSAGATLSIASALRARDIGGPKIQAQMLLYPGTGYPDTSTAPSLTENAEAPFLTLRDLYFCWQKYLGDVEKNRQNPYACPMSAATFAGLPSAFVGSAEYDPLRDDDEALAAKLATDGVPTVARRYDGMPHGFYGLIGFSKRVEEAIDELAAWLKNALNA